MRITRTRYSNGDWVVKYASDSGIVYTITNLGGIIFSDASPVKVYSHLAHSESNK